MDKETMRRIQNFGTQHSQWDAYQKAKKAFIKKHGKAEWEKAVSNK